MLQLETLSAVICCQGREESSRQHHSSKSCGHLSFPVTEAFMSGRCPSASQEKRGAGWVQSSRWCSHNCQSRWFCLDMCIVLISLLSTLGVQRRSVEVTPMWVTYATAKPSKTQGLLCSMACWAWIPHELVTRVSTRSCSSMALGSRDKFPLPWPRNQPPPTMP